MHGRVVFLRFQMGEDFGRHAEFRRQAFFQQRRQPMCLADGHGVREQQVHFDELPIPRCAVANTVILQSQFAANGIQLVTDLLYRSDYFASLRQTLPGALRLNTGR